MTRSPGCSSSSFTRLASAIALLASALAVGCGGSPPSGDPPGEVAEVSLSLLQAPSDVRCLVVTAALDPPVVRRFDASPGQPTVFVLPRLPVGRAVVSLDAFPVPCAMVTATSVPTWVGGPVTVVLVPGANPPIVIPMRRNAQASVSVDFPTTPAPVCAALNASCIADADCCSQRCVVPAGSLTGIGQCQAPTMPTGPSVQIAVMGGKSYVMYSLGPNGGGCDPTGGTTWVATVDEGDSACLGPGVGDVTPIPVLSVRSCNPTTGCQPCTDTNCLLASCFRPAPLLIGATCATPLEGVAGRDQTQYLLLRKIDTRMPPARPDGLPRVINASVNGTITIFPPATQQAFAVANLGTPLEPPATPGDMCGGSDLCGIVPFQGSSGLPSWSFSGLTLSWSPLF
jgi:hypothetical protein